MSEHRELRITRGNGSEHVVLYDLEDADVVESHSWYIKPKVTPGLFYACTELPKLNGQRGKKVLMHVLLSGHPGVDHINRNGLDNRRSNLRPATSSQNAANRPPQRGGSSQYKGVGWNKAAGKWKSKIRVDYRYIHIGYFDDELSAAKAYDARARAAFGEFAYLNFPELADG